MPVLTTTPYPTAEDILIAARVMANDAQMSIDGDILADSQPYIFPLLELCYEKLQRRLIRSGINTYSKYGYVNGLTPVATSDIGTQVQLLYSGYYDGVNMAASPTLPADLIAPLEIWERQTDSTGPWIPMKQASDSISSRAQTARFGIWDWETDVLYFPGASQSNDLKMKYILLAPAITGPTSPILVAGCKVALAALVGEMVAKSRGGLEAAAVYHQEAENEVQLLIAPTARKEQYANFQRRPFRGRQRGRR